MDALGERRSCDINDPGSVVELARETRSHLVVIGPENPLANGVADALHAAGIPVFGPSREAARLEWDKAYAKEFMYRYGIPTSTSVTFSVDQLNEAEAYVAQGPFPVVIKACGLAAGKGVAIAHGPMDAVDAVRSMLVLDEFGTAGHKIVVEEFMEGEEASVFAVTDGTRYVVLTPSQDHKRIGDGDTGPNTGGMGAYAPATIVDDQMLQRIMRAIVEPTLVGMRESGTPFVGCLFVGLMINAAGEPRVVEFNSRFGDPEAQVVVPLYDGDFLDLLYAAAVGALPATGQAPSRGAAVCVVIASEGYPGKYRTGLPISGINSAEALEGVVVFHAGTTEGPGGVVTSGGRVLGVTAFDGNGDVAQAIALAYKGVDLIRFQGAYHRSDIARRAALPASSL